MVTRSKKQNTSEQEEKEGRVKIEKLKLNKETIKDLTDSEKRRARGGIRAVDEEHSNPVANCLSFTCVTVCTRNLDCI
jgi:hypothetical protein